MPHTLLDKIQYTEKVFYDELAIITDDVALQTIKKKYTAREGILAKITEEFKKCSLEEKKEIGNLLLQLKENINNAFIEKKNNLFLAACSFPSSDEFDPGLEKKDVLYPTLHPYSLAIEMISDFFHGIGFSIVEGPIIVTEYDNFTALNIPYNHPARDEHDTFWIEKNNILLRTHTSSVQVSEARKRTAPFGIISVGPVYRNEATDATHDFMFYQLEGVFFGPDASISSLLFTLRSFFNAFFEKKDLKVRARPGIFPFVEPGLEIDFECPFCFDGCSTCKRTRWIELGGAGMVHSFVKREMNIEDDVLGWAFGMGLTRLIMIKYQITDIRDIHNTIVEL